MDRICVVDVYQRMEEADTLAAIRSDFPQYVKCVVAGNGLLHQLMKRGREEKWDSFKFYYELICLNRQFQRMGYLAVLQMYGVEVDFFNQPKYKKAYNRFFSLKYPNHEPTDYHFDGGSNFTDLYGFQEFGNEFLEICVRSLIHVQFG
jgi:hypothetical protein